MKNLIDGKKNGKRGKALSCETKFEHDVDTIIKLFKL